MIPLNYPNDPVEGFEHLELGFPWIVVESAEKLNEVIKSNDIVIEMGMGGSTIFFAERCLHITSVETSESWYKSVESRVSEKGLTNVQHLYIPTQEQMENWLRLSDLSSVNIFSVDTQGGYSRSGILNAFLEKGVSENLRIIVLDNYGHEGLFPDHYDKENFMGDDWEVFTYNHERWAGFGTRIYIKK